MEDHMELEEIRSSLQSMTASIVSVRQTIRKLLDDPQSLNTKDGISLLSIKHHVFLSYLRSLVLLSCRRTLGHTLTEREPPKTGFSSSVRDRRGSGAGDLVDSMIEGRIVLEKTRALEGKLKYQIEKLVRLAREPERAEIAINDPLAFRPNPQNLRADDNDDDDGPSASHGGMSDSRQPEDGIYRPPRLAPVPYTEGSKSKSRGERARIPSALNHLAADPSRPHAETTSGLGGIPQLGSKRAAHLRRLQEFEEDNFTRVMMKKSEAKRRLRDEADLALGGDLGGSYNPRARRRAGGLEDEFGDVLRSVERKNHGFDGYEELQKKGKKADILSRSRDSFSRKRASAFGDGADGEETPRMKKRSRFELEAKSAKRKMRRKQ